MEPEGIIIRAVDSGATVQPGSMVAATNTISDNKMVRWKRFAWPFFYLKYK
jgi:hypothetical protein